MSADYQFPLDLLSSPIKDRIAYFEEKVIGHLIQLNVFDQILEAIDELPLGSFIFVYGPTGVGKTTLISRVVKELIIKYEQEMIKDLDFMPVVSTQIASIDTIFYIRDYYKRCLLAMHEPMLEKKIMSERKIRKDYPSIPAEWIPQGRNADKSDLRGALEKALIGRKVRFYLIDEAQHVITGSSGRSAIAHLNTLKSLANITDVTHVLFGTYELITDGLNGQMNRRSESIHFHRYRLDVEDEMDEFKTLICKFQQHMPLEVQPDLADLTDYMYVHTLGCVGILKNWLNRALRRTLRQKEQILTKSILDQTALPNRKLNQLAREIREGEAFLKDVDTLDEVDLLLKRGKSGTSTPPSPEKGKTDGKKNKPGTRKPGRDGVGNNAETE